MIRKLISEGRTAEVFEYTDNEINETKKVLKLYKKGYSEKDCSFEILCQNIAISHELSVPKVYGEYKEDNRFGIIFERIEGDTLLHHLKTDAKNIKNYARDFARLMLSYHSVKLNGELRKVDYIKIINKVEDLDPVLKEKLIRHYQSLPQGNCLCHGDYHPDNIIVNGQRLVAIDWVTGYEGHPSSDVCRTLLIMDTPFGRKDMKWYEKLIVNRFVRIFNQTFIEEYLANSNITKKDIYQWMPVIAAARFLENVPLERKWLNKIIRKYNKLI